MIFPRRGEQGARPSKVMTVHSHKVKKVLLNLHMSTAYSLKHFLTFANGQFVHFSIIKKNWLNNHQYH